MRQYFLSVIFVAIFLNGYSQLVIEGKVLIQPDRTPIAYANIGIPRTNIGTISNADGSFSIRIPAEHLKDTILFSAIGYNRRRIPVSFLARTPGHTVFLAEHVTQLDAVTIVGKKEKPKVFELGNRYFRGGIVAADSIYAGTTYALLIENKFPSFHAELAFPAYVQKTRVRIFKNNFPEFKFRVRLFAVDSVTGEPGQDLLNESIVQESTARKGWIEIDLSKINLKINGPFFIGYEWILNDDDRLAVVNGFREFRKAHPERITHDSVIVDGKKIANENINWDDFSGTAISVSPLKFSRDNYKCYTRKSSFSEWIRSNSILTARVLLSDTPAFSTNSVKVVEHPCRDSELICSVKKICEDFLEEYPVNGIQLSVSVKGEIKFSQGFGLADVDNNIPVSTSTRFRVGSVSKSLTSAALSKLVSDGLLDLDAPVQKYTPFPAKAYVITTRQLAGHLSGIRHYRNDDPGDLSRTEHYKNSSDALLVFQDDSLLFQPGSQFHYSSYGWNLVGAVIEGASGQSYLRYMQGKIWQPLNMTNTYGDVADSLMSGRSKFYDLTGEEAAKEDLSYKYSGGGLLSTTEDLVKYGNELLHPHYLNTSATRMLFETQYVNKKPTEYGLGWYIGKDKNGHRIWFHAGDLLNSSAYLILYPDDEIVIAFAANAQEGLKFNVQRIGELLYRK